MTVITVNAGAGVLTRAHREALALSLTDAVLEVEVGQAEPRARPGFQVWFRNFEIGQMAIGGTLLTEEAADRMMLVDIVVMDGAWPKGDRAAIVDRIYAALRVAFGLAEVPPGWWVVFRTIDDGSWGSRGGVLSLADLLSSGVFTPERIDAIRDALTA